MGEEATLPSWHSVVSPGRCWARSVPGSEAQPQAWGRTQPPFPNAFPPSTSLFSDLGHQDPERRRGLPWVAQPGWGATRGRPQALAPAPLWHSPASAPGELEEGGGTWCQAAEAGVGDWMAPCTTTPAPPPPRLPSLAPSTGCPAAGTSARAQTSIHTRALAPSFFSALLFPPQLEAFFFPPSPLSLPTCHYSRNKKRGDNAGIDGGPLAAPSPRGACQHSFHPPRAGTPAKGPCS